MHTRAASKTSAAPDLLSFLSNDILLAVLRWLEARSLGKAMQALGQRARPPAIEREVLLDLITSRLHLKQETKLTPEQLQYVTYGADDSLPSRGISRISFPYEARLNFKCERARILKADENPEKSWPDLCGYLYAHDMAVFESRSASEKCTLFSLCDAREETPPHACVLFLVSLGIRNDCDPGCFCCGRHYVAVDVLLPEATKSEIVWLYDFALSQADGDEKPTHTAIECKPALAKKLIMATGLDVLGDAPDKKGVYELVELLSILGGSNGRHINAFARFLDARATYRQRALAKASKYDDGDEDDEFMDEFMDEDDEPYAGKRDAAYFKFPAVKRAVVLPTQAEWGVEADVDGRPTMPTGFKAIRPRLLRGLARINRSSLPAVVNATMGFGAKYSKDLFMEEAAECDDE